MALIERVVFLALDGNPPAALGLRPLATFEATWATIARTLAPYLAAEARRRQVFPTLGLEIPTVRVGGCFQPDG